MKSLDHSLVTGVGWITFANWFGQLVRWASTIVVISLLTPNDYGIAALAILYVGFLQLFSGGGLGLGITRDRKLSEEQIARIGGLCVVIGCGLFLIAVLLSGQVARFFDEDALQPVVIALGGMLLIQSVRVVPQGLLTRNLRFRRQAWIDGIESVVLALSTLTLAVLEYGYWALILGQLISAAVASAMTLSAAPHPIAWPGDLRLIWRPLSEGWRLVVTRLCWYFYSRSDVAIVGYLLGKAALGAYAVGWSIASIPIDKVSIHVNRVILGIYATIQEDAGLMQRYLSNLTKIISLALFPACAGIALVASELVPVVLGDKWRPAIWPLALLSIATIFRSVTVFFTPLLLATGNVHCLMRFNLTAMVVLPAAFYLGAGWDTVGVAFMWVSVYPVLASIMIVSEGLRVVGLTAGEYLGLLTPALKGTVAMSSTVLMFKFVTDEYWTSGAILAGEIALGVIVYGSYLAIAQRQEVGNIVKNLKSLLTDSRHESAAQ